MQIHVNFKVGHMRTVLVATQAQCECQHHLLLTVRLWNPSVSGHDWLTEGNQWSETWFGVKRSIWMRQHIWIPCVCVCAAMRMCVYWIPYYSLWCLCASWGELVQRGARFESLLLDRMERLESEQVLHGEEDLLRLWLIKRTAVMWSHIQTPYQHFTPSRRNGKNKDSISRW